jgi:hypothetical protein
MAPNYLRAVDESAKSTLVQTEPAKAIPPVARLMQDLEDELITLGTALDGLLQNIDGVMFNGPQPCENETPSQFPAATSKVGEYFVGRINTVIAMRRAIVKAIERSEL